MTPRARRSSTWSLVAATAGTAVVLLVPAYGAPAYLGAFVLIASIPLGSAGVLMLWHSTGGAWGEPIRTRLELAATAAPILPILFVPIAVAAPKLYPWVHAGETPVARFYFHPLFVGVRAVAFLAAWSIGGPWLAAASRAVPPGERAGPRLRGACAAGLVVYVITATFAFTDWVLSLTPEWHSSDFGVIVVCSQGLTAMALVTGAAALQRLRGGDVRGAELRDLGSLLFAFVLFHAYVSFVQFFIIWNGDVPARTSWYVSRTRGLWEAVVLAVVVFQFAFPLSALLFRRLRDSPRAMTWICASLLAGAVLEAAWLTLPSAGVTGTWSALYLACAAALGAVFTPTLLTRGAAAAAEEAP
jgi:hypothetical protein